MSEQAAEPTEDLLADLLAVAEEELTNCGPTNKLVDVDLFGKQSDGLTSSTSQTQPTKNSLVHEGETDSSDDEQNKYYENQRYNQYGKDVRFLLEPTTTATETTERRLSTWKSSATAKTVPPPKKLFPEKSDVYTDPVFGIRIVKPLISSTVLQERMVGRQAVPMANIKKFVAKEKIEEDWVVAGVIVNKLTKTASSGKQYCIWTLCDLHSDLKTVGLFLFGSAYKEFWKSSVGTVVGILNPTVFENKAGSKDEATLNVDNSQRIMIFGQSKDFGTCRSTKKNGEKCTAFVNTNRCEYCIYHVKQEYQKCSQRSELQSSFAGRGLVALRNKVLGKNEVFYAGKSYMAIPASKSKKVTKKDENRLQFLSGAGVSVTKGRATQAKIKKHAAHVEAAQNQRKRDLEILRKLGCLDEAKTSGEFAAEAHSSSVTLEESKKTALDVISKLKAKQQNAKKEVDSEKSAKSESKVLLKQPETGEIDLSVDFGAKTTLKKKVSKDLNGDIKKKNNIKAQEKNLEEALKEKSICKEDNLNKNIKATNGKETSLNAKESSETKNVAVTLKNVDLNSVTEKEKSLNCNSDLKNTPSTEEQQKSVSKPLDCSIKTIENDQKTTTKENIVATPKILSAPLKFVDLSAPLPKRKIDRAKQTALKYIQKNGPIKKVDPNSTRGNKKRALATDATENEAKRLKHIQENEFYSEKFKKLMAKTSRNADLLELRDDEEKEKYFDKMVMKEKMEEKMTTTYKVPCKAVRCLQCKYTSFSAADRCKTERHPLKVADAIKRFFKCGDCGNRTVCLEVVPTRPCNSCGSGKWERTTMMKERKVVLSHGLSIRGGEQKFVNSVVSDANINLLMPDE